MNFLWKQVPISWQSKRTECKYNRVQRKSFLQLAIRASWSQDLLAQMSFQLAPKFLTSRIDFTVLLLFKFLEKHHLPFGQVRNRIQWPKSKIHYPRAIEHYFLCTLCKKRMFMPCDIIFVGIIYDVIVEPPSVGSTTDEFGHSKPVSLQFFPFNITYSSLFALFYWQFESKHS